MHSDPTAASTPSPSLVGVTSTDDITGYLRRLRAWAGNVSYPELARRVNAARGPRDPRAGQTTVYDCFRSGRKRLDSDLVMEIAAALGLDTDGLSRLRRTIQAILDASESSAVADVSGSIPSPSPHFTGRRSVLRTIAQQLRKAADTSTAPVVTITGPAGIGKTETAFNAAHQLLSRGHCRDAQLFANLHGFDLEQPPTSPEAVLVGLLTLLKVPDEKIHSRRTLRAKTELLCSTLNGKKAILVLDNAAGLQQVEALLPNTSSCVVVITSRQRFTASKDVDAVPLDALDTDDAVDLLRGYDPHDRINADPDIARRIATDLCGGMPLDLSAIGAQLADPDEAHWTLADHAARLARFPRDEISRPALAASYHRLPSDTQRTFRLLSLHPGNDFTPYDAAALDDRDLAGTETALTQLADRHLLFHREPGRYKFHDTIRAFSTRLRDQADPASTQDAAFERLLHFQRHGTARAMEHYAPQLRNMLPDASPSNTPEPSFVDNTEALTWLNAERSNLVISAVHAAKGGHIDHTSDMSALLARYLGSRSLWYTAETLHSHACMSQDRARRSKALNSLGAVRVRIGRNNAAAETLQDCIALSREVDDRDSESAALTNLGHLYQNMGDFHRAFDCQSQALAAFRKTGNRYGEGIALSNLGIVHKFMHRYGAALDYQKRALSLAQHIGDQDGEGIALGNLGNVYLAMHRQEEALRCQQEALEIFRARGDRNSEGHALDNLGRVYQDQGKYDMALRRFNDALNIAQDVGGNSELRCAVLNNIAHNFACQMQAGSALEHHNQAQCLANETGERFEEARALDGIGQILAERGETEQAREHWRQALELYRDMGVPEADDVAARLAEVGVDE